MGRILVDKTDHDSALRIEMAVHALPEGAVSPDLLAKAQAAYMRGLASAYYDLHDALGDTFAPDVGTDSYVARAATLARGLAISPFKIGARPDPLDQFINLASEFTYT